MNAPSRADHCLRVFVWSPVMNDIPGVNDDVGSGIERVYVRNSEREIAHSLIGVGGIQCQMSIGNLRDDHDLALWSLDPRPA